MAINAQAAVDVGQLAQRYATGLYSYDVAMLIASSDDAEAILPTLQELVGGSGTVPRKDGTSHGYLPEHFLREIREDAELRTDLERLWLAGALTNVGDALTVHQFFGDGAPLLQMMRHLRNGVAHGNRFEIRNPQDLASRPANTHRAYVQSDLKTVYEITPALHGMPVLFDFMGPADVCDLLQAVADYLLRLSRGEPGYR